jgi:hypothetical protein
VTLSARVRLARLGLSDHACETSNKQRCERPRRQLENPAANRDRVTRHGLSGGTGPPSTGLNKGDREVQADPHTFQRRARRTRRRRCFGVCEPTVGAEGDVQGHCEDHNAQQAQECTPRLVSVAEGDVGEPAPGPLSPSRIGLGKLLLALSHQNLAGQCIMTGSL